jgi:hypothetical protein
VLAVADLLSLMHIAASQKHICTSRIFHISILIDSYFSLSIVMSGLETTGKVLWSLSVVIAALEHYEKGIHTCTTKHFRRHKSELRSLRLQLGTERDIFINMLEQLLEGLVEIEHMTKFLSDSEGEAWQNAKLDMKLRARLGDEYEVYLGNVDGMKRSLEMIREKLALDPDGKVTKSIGALAPQHTTNMIPDPIF